MAKTKWISRDGIEIPLFGTPERKQYDTAFKDQLQTVFGGPHATLRPLKVPIKQLNELSGNGPVNKDRLKLYTQMAQGGDRLPPIVVRRNPNDTFDVVDGSHRRAAAKTAGLRGIDAYELVPSGMPIQKSEPKPGDHFDYEHVLKPEHTAAGYTVRVVPTLHPDGSHELHAELHHRGMPVGKVSGVLHEGHLAVDKPEMMAGHKNRGLGLALHHALLGHAKHGLGAVSVSSPGPQAHQKLAERHGLAYHPAPLQKMALGLIPPGKPEGENELTHTKGWDYSHVLPEQYHGKYRIQVQHKAADRRPVGENTDLLHAKLFHRGSQGWQKVGSLEGGFDTNKKHLNVDYAAVHDQHRGRGLGLGMYEALFAHARNVLGGTHVAGGEHSTLARSAHQKLAAKHGLNYGAPQIGPSSGEFDDAFGPYKYALKSQHEILERKLVKTLGWKPPTIAPLPPPKVDISKSPKPPAIAPLVPPSATAAKVAPNLPGLVAPPKAQLNTSVESFMGELKGLPKEGPTRGKFITQHMNSAPFLAALQAHPQGPAIHKQLTGYLNGAANAGFKRGANQAVVKSEEAYEEAPVEPTEAEIASFRSNNAEFLKQPRNRCVDASIGFLHHLKVPAEDHYHWMASNRNANPNEFQDHYWTRFGDLNVDWTAHQYSPGAAVPLTWRGNGPHPLHDVIVRRHGAVKKAEDDQSQWWHGTPSGDLRGGPVGLHLGTRQAATEALHARIGIPVQGAWDGTREYGKTLLAGQKTLRARGIFPTGYNCGAPEEDHYPTGTAAFGDGSPVLATHKPSIFPVRIVGPMTNTPHAPHGDTRANALMAGQLKRGTAKRGFYYTNDGEDAGSVSAVVPNGAHLAAGNALSVKIAEDVRRLPPAKQKRLRKALRLNAAKRLKKTANLQEGSPASLEDRQETAVNMLGFNPHFHHAFKAARFLVGGKAAPLEQMRRALWDHDGDHVAAALSLYGIADTKENRKALEAHRDLSSLEKAEDSPVPKAALAVVPSAVRAAAALNRAFADGTFQDVKLNGKHSSGALLATDHESGLAFLLKPNAGGVSPAAGVSEETANQARREAAFWHASRLFGLQDYLARADVVAITDSTGQSREWAAIQMLPSEWVPAEQMRETDPNWVTRSLEKYRGDGTLHQWAAMDYVLGNPDRHWGNALMHGTDIKLIDQGSALAGKDFAPGSDRNSFVPFYLRYQCPTSAFNKLAVESKLRWMPSVSKDIDEMLRVWILGIDPNVLASLLRSYGIHPQACVERLKRLQSVTGSMSRGINDCWAAS